MTKRTDMAIEFTSHTEAQKGIKKSHRNNIFSITEIEISDSKAAEFLKKPTGKYITMETDSFDELPDKMQSKSEAVATELRKLLPKTFGKAIIACLGNRSITPDAYGPVISDYIIATRHLKKECSKLFGNLNEVCVIAGGTVGQTGIESVELIKAAVNEIKADVVIATDALCCHSVHRLGKSIQLSDSGISPGSGVENKRKEISSKTLGIPVISIGVPTVMDMDTENGEETMIITPRNIDKIIKNSSRITAYGINLALQPELNFKDILNLSE